MARQRSMIPVIEVDSMFVTMNEIFERWELGEEERMEETKGSPYYLFHKGRKEAYAHCLSAVYGAKRRLLEVYEDE
ncbi:MAG: hypothetical protein ACYDDH_12005 [Candidatus Desulforudaceae bacterium]